MRRKIKIALCLLLMTMFACIEGNQTVQAQVADNSQKVWHSDFKDASLVSIKDDKVKLSDYVGKSEYVLVDFWASWCGPCMREMPNVKAAYEKYKSRGLQVLGINLDKDQNAWKNAVGRLELKWPQLSDMNEQGSVVANLYAVKYIPYIVIFDKSGKMVAKNLHGEALAKKLEELMPAQK